MARNLKKIIIEQQFELERMLQTPVLDRLPMKKVGRTIAEAPLLSDGLLQSVRSV